jgi:PST family polysaccharide transporter
VPHFASNKPIFLLAFISVVGNVLFPAWLYRGLERMKLLSALAIFGRAFSAAAIFLFVRGQHDLLLAVIFQSSSSLLSGLLALVFLPRLSSIEYAQPTRLELMQTFADGWHAFLSTSAISIYTFSNTFILGLMTAPAVVGYYAAASKIISAFVGLASPVSQAVYPHIVDLIAKSRVKALEFISRLLIAQGGAMLALSIIVFVFAPIMVRALLGPMFESCVLLVRIMAALPFVIGLSNVFGIQIMMAFDMKRAFSRILVGCSLLNVVILFPSIALAGAAGAACCLLIVECIVTAAMLAVLVRQGTMGEIFAARPRTPELT